MNPQCRIVGDLSLSFLIRYNRKRTASGYILGVKEMNGWFLWFILLWVVVLVSLFAIGGFFMFRKFLKRMPKQDGKSDMDWEEYYVEKTKQLWTPEHNKLLDELVSPVPELFRDVARQKIAGKIGELALKEKVKKLI